jgi:hypothetical protein
VISHVTVADEGTAEVRSSAHIGMDDLARLSKIARTDLRSYIARDPASRELFETKILCVTLCQGAALHFVDKVNGVKDFDVFIFFVADGSRKFPARRRGVHDFGRSHFGRHPDDQGFVGRRVDVMGRSIARGEGESPIQAVCKYLGQRPTATAWHLAQKSVVVIDPPALRGTVIWPIEA